MTSAPAILLGCLLALFASHVLAGSCTDCNDNGFCYSVSGNSYCACHSGFMGTDCETAIAGGCDFGDVNVTTTSFAPVEINVFFAADVLNVRIVSPLVTERNYTLIAIDDTSFNNEACVYPGLYWEREFTACNDTFIGAMPWADNVACGWSVNNTGNAFAVYTAQMVIEHHDFIDPFGNRNASTYVERETQHVVPLTISFPKNITVQSTITVQAPVRLLAAVSRQTVNPDGQSAIIEVATNLIWPYILTEFDLLSTTAGINNTGTVVSEVVGSRNCPNDGSSCTQVFRIEIDPGAACTLNGQYNLQWVIDCQQTSGQDPPQCAIQTGDLATAALVVVSENFCATVSTVLPLTGSVASFGDSGRSQAKTQFLVGQTLYWRATVVSTNVSLDGATIRSAKLISNDDADVLLYADGQVVNDGVAAAFSTDTSNDFSADFHYTLTSAFIDNIPDDSTREYTMIVVVDVDYQNVITTKRGRRSIEFTSPLNSQPVAISSSFRAEPAPALDNDAVALSKAFAFAFSFIFAVYTLL